MDFIQGLMFAWLFLFTVAFLLHGHAGLLGEDEENESAYCLTHEHDACPRCVLEYPPLDEDDDDLR